MRRLILTAALIFLGTAAFAFPYATKFSDETEEYTAPVYITNQQGDQYIKLSLGVVFPMNFPDVESLFHTDQHQLSLGGMGPVGYHYFLTGNFALGFDVGFGFNTTIGSHILNYVPILFSVTYQPKWRMLEFPLSLNAGFAWESYNNKNYFPGLVLKPEAGVHFRIDENWSVGLEGSWMILPQFCEWYDTGKNYTGHFFTLAAAARYYF